MMLWSFLFEGLATTISSRQNLSFIGHFPRISEQLDQLYTELCPDDTYQPEGAMSNKFKKVTCDYKKNKCDELGESYCSRGSTTSDVQCKCDYMKGYSASEYLLENPKNQTCYTKTHGARCYMWVCKNGTELNPGKIYIYLCYFLKMTRNDHVMYR